MHLLNASAGEEWKDEFEAAMRLNMVYPAVSLFTPPSLFLSVSLSRSLRNPFCLTYSVITVR